MNHVAFDVPADKFEEYVEQAAATRASSAAEVMNHDDSESTVSRRACTDGVFVRSIYFLDPDGVLLEFACWTDELTEDDVSHAPARAISNAVPTPV